MKEILKNKQIGIDIVDVDRFRRKKFLDNISFYEKIFTDLEIIYCRKFSDPYPHFAGKFALKEAVRKSIREKIVFKKIETFHIDSRPRVRIDNNDGQYEFITSISHEKKYAIAVTISERLHNHST